MIDRGWLSSDEDQHAVSADGIAGLAQIGIDVHLLARGRGR